MAEHLFKVLVLVELAVLVEPEVEERLALEIPQTEMVELVVMAFLLPSRALLLLGVVVVAAEDMSEQVAALVVVVMVNQHQQAPQEQQEQQTLVVVPVEILLQIAPEVQEL